MRKWTFAGGAMLLAALAAGCALADGAASRVPTPVIEGGRGDKCVADTDFMRRNHMKLLMHQRDDTLRAGVRTPRFSLQGCISCHAGKTGTVVGGSGNFCQSCHTYAAVTIDCFVCHASKPGGEAKAASRTTPAGLATVAGGNGSTEPVGSASR
jgi:hypothetical protein